MYDSAFSYISFSNFSVFNFSLSIYLESEQLLPLNVFIVQAPQGREQNDQRNSLGFIVLCFDFTRLHNE